MTTLCSVEGCSGGVVSKGFCQNHYYRFRRYGNALSGVDYEQKAKKRFLSSFVENPGECFLWVKNKDRHGYGKMSVLRKTVQAHRFSWEFFNGEKIPAGMVVMHLCNNKGCVNPDHLQLGTLKDNSLHSVVTGQSRVAFLKESDVRLIRSSSLTSKELAEIFGVSFSCIDDVRKEKTWRSV